MKNLFIILTVFLFSTVSAQEYRVQVLPENSKLWGYANEKGELLIAPQFKKCFEFSENGTAPAYDPKTREHTFIRKDGTSITPERSGFVLMNLFGLGLKGYSDGLAAVSYSKKWGFIDEQGKIVIAPQYDKVTRFTEGYAVATLGTDHFILTKSGDTTRINSVQAATIKAFSEGLAAFRLEDGKVGFLNEKGKVHIAPSFKSAGDFSAGLAWAKTEEGKVGFINKKGEWVIQPLFDAAHEFSVESKLARVKQGANWSYVKPDGKLITPENVKSCGDFSNGLAYAKTTEGLVGFINEKGEWAIPAQFESTHEFNCEYASVKSNGKWGIIDKKGNWICPPQFSNMKKVIRIQ